MERLKQYFKNKNILITGGLGFLGSNLAHRLVNSNANITLLDNLNPLYGGNKFNIKEIEENVKVVIGDVRDNNILLPIIQKADIIFHFAAQVSYIDSLSMPFEDLGLNAKTTLQILEICRKYNSKAKILFSSSRMVMGKIEDKHVTESSATNPLSLYGIHKLTSEKYLQMYYKDFGIPFVILRITNPYGPRQQIKHNKYSLVGWFIRQAMEGKTIKIFGDGKQLRDYIFVDDIVEAFLRCSIEENAIGKIINIGSGISTEFREMVKGVINIVQNGYIEYVEWPPVYEHVETGDIVVDISRLKEITGFQPKYNLKDGIHKTYDYYKYHFKDYVEE